MLLFPKRGNLSSGHGHDFSIMKLNAFAPLITAIIGALQLSLALVAAQPTTDLPWQYILLKGSEIVDDCPICDRVPIPVPIHGSFQLRLSQHGPLFSYYTLENIDFSGGSPFGISFKITGQGTYQVGGQLAVMQSMFLGLQVDQDQATQQCYFETPNGLVERSWPFLQLGLTQTNGTMVSNLYAQADRRPGARSLVFHSPRLHPLQFPGRPPGQRRGPGFLPGPNRKTQRRAPGRFRAHAARARFGPGRGGIPAGRRDGFFHHHR